MAWEPGVPLSLLAPSPDPADGNDVRHAGLAGHLLPAVRAHRSNVHIGAGFMLHSALATSGAMDHSRYPAGIVLAFGH